MTRNRGYEYCERTIDADTTPKYVKKQMRLWMDVCEGKSDKYLVSDAKIRQMESILKLLIMPKGLKAWQTLYECTTGYQWLLYTAVLCTVYRDNPEKRRYEIGLLEIARKNFKTYTVATIFIILMLTEPRFAEFHIKDNFEETYKFAIYPIVRAFETALNRDLLLEREKRNYFFAFDSREIIKASLKERYETYQLAKECGIMTINEMRRNENMNEVAGLDLIDLGLGSVLFDTTTGETYTPNTDSTKAAGISDSGSAAQAQGGEADADDKQVVDKTMDKVDDVVRKPLLVGQMQSMESIIAGYTAGNYTASQAKSMLIVGCGLSDEDADRVLDLQEQTEQQVNDGTGSKGGEANAD